MKNFTLATMIVLQIAILIAFLSIKEAERDCIDVNSKDPLGLGL